MKGSLDDLEIPKEDYKRIIRFVGLKPTIDLMASKNNKKTKYYIDKKKNIFKTQLRIGTGWLNAPHSIYKNVITYIHYQYQLYDFNLVILIPANNVRTSYWQKYIEPYNMFINTKGHLFWYPYDRPIKFLKKRKPILNKHGRPEHAHNSYFVLCYIKKSNRKSFKQRIRKIYIGKAKSI